MHICVVLCIYAHVVQCPAQLATIIVMGQSKGYALSSACHFLASNSLLVVISN